MDNNVFEEFISKYTEKVYKDKDENPAIFKFVYTRRTHRTTIKKTENGWRNTKQMNLDMALAEDNDDRLYKATMDAERIA